MNLIEKSNLGKNTEQKDGKSLKDERITWKVEIKLSLYINVDNVS